MATRPRCKKCGKACSKYSPNQLCNKCHAEKMAGIKAANVAIVKMGKCPRCGAKLKRNLSLSGWYQCEQLGADTHRKDPSKPSCDFQVFI